MATITHPRPAQLDGPDPGLDLPLGRVAVAHHAPAAMLVHEIGIGGDNRLDLGLERLRQHPPGAIAQYCQ